MIYFDNAATSFPKAPGVSAAMSRFLAESAANPGRAGHRLAVAAERMIDDVRWQLTRLVDGADPQRMIFTLNATDALNIALKGILHPLLARGEHPHVITTVLEHNSVSRPLEAMARRHAIDLQRIDCDDDGFIDPQDIRKAIQPHTRMVVLTHASNVLGTIQDAAAIGKIAREHDLIFGLDGAQTAGVVPISVASMQIDWLALPGHKSLLGPTGTGALYWGERCPVGADLSPWREGGTGGDSSSPTQPDLFPYYLEGGTPNTVGLAGLAAGIDYVSQRGLPAILQHEQDMVRAILERLGADPRFNILGSRDASRRVGTVCFTLENYEAPDLGSILDDSFQIAVRPGLHCAPYVHQRMGTFPLGAVRISPGPFNTREELAALLDALAQIAG